MESHKVDAPWTKQLWQIADRYNYLVLTRHDRKVSTSRAEPIQKSSAVAMKLNREDRNWNVLNCTDCLPTGCSRL